MIRTTVHFHSCYNYVGTVHVCKLSRTVPFGEISSFLRWTVSILYVLYIATLLGEDSPWLHPLVGTPLTTSLLRELTMTTPLPREFGLITPLPRELPTTTLFRENSSWLRPFRENSPWLRPLVRIPPDYAPCWDLPDYASWWEISLTTPLPKELPMTTPLPTELPLTTPLRKDSPLWQVSRG